MKNSKVSIEVVVVVAICAVLLMLKVIAALYNDNKKCLQQKRKTYTEGIVTRDQHSFAIVEAVAL